MKAQLRKQTFSRPQLIIFVLAFALIGFILVRTFAANPNLPGDINNDNTVNITDLSILLTNYGTTNATADLNADNTVNITDLSILLSHFGQSYTSGANCNIATSSWQNTSFTNQTGTITATYNVIPGAAGTDGVVGFSNGPATGYDSLAVSIRFSTANTIEALNGTSYSSTTPMSYTTGKTYNFRVVANISTHSYNAYVTPAGSSEVQFANNYAFRTTQASATQLNNTAFIASAGSMQVCQITVNGTSSPPPPTSGLPFPEASLKSGYITLTVPVAQQTITCPSGNDCLIDLQNIKRAGSLLIYGYSNSNIKVIKGYWEVTKPIDGSPYWRGGPRIRSSDGLGPANVSLTDMRITGTTLADGIAIDASINTKVTIQKTRIEYLTLSSAEPAEHIDAIQVQGPIGELNVGLSTLGLAGVNPANDAGKGFMLKKETAAARPFTVNLKSVNFLANGRTGANIFQDTRDITVNLDNNVWVYKSDTAGCVWSSGSCIFYPDIPLGTTYSWYSSGTAPNRIADWPDASGIFGQAHEGLPPNGNFAP